MTFQTYKSIILLVIKINWIGVRYKTFFTKEGGWNEKFIYVSGELQIR